MYRSYLKRQPGVGMDIVLPAMSTALSPSVKQLVLETTWSEIRDPRVLDQVGLLDFMYICSRLPDDDKPGQENGAYFQRSVAALAPMMTHVEGVIQALGVTDLRPRYAHLLQWTGHPQLVLDQLCAMKENSPVGDLSSLLTVSAILERALGNLYLTRGPGLCPSMLRDLLVTPQLRDLLGQDVITVLRIVMGPPISLNLRNLAWHGFPVPGELPRRCIWFLLLLVPSIGQVLCKRQLQVAKHREPVIFPQIQAPGCRLLVGDIQPWVTAIQTSQLVTWDTNTFWGVVKQFYDQQRYSLCAALLLYYIEQGIRRLFATVNNCPQRILTAESTVLFTTFNEMFNEYLPDGTENQLARLLGEPTMEMLFDLLVYPDGPRVRDRLSHGEADWATFPHMIVDQLALCAVALSATVVQDRPIQNGSISPVLSEISSYEGQFHRVDIIRQNVRCMVTEVYSIDVSMCPSPDLQQRQPDGPYITDTGQLQTLHDGISYVVKLIIKTWTIPYTDEDIFNSIICLSHNEQCRACTEGLLKPKVHTLYRMARNQTEDGSVVADRDGEMIGLLFHVAMEMVTVARQLQETLRVRQAQLKEKQLRSRQRQNFQAFLSRCPFYMTTVNCLAVLVTWQLHSLDGLQSLPDTLVKQRVKCWKAVLKLSENLRTCTHPDRNRWTDGVDLILQMLPQIVVHLRDSQPQVGDQFGEPQTAQSQTVTVSH